MIEMEKNSNGEDLNSTMVYWPLVPYYEQPQKD